MNDNDNKRKKPSKNRKPRRDVIEKSCGVILYRNNEGTREYLLLHYPGGHWDFAKGHVEEFDENERGTACRELEEETGISEISFHDNYREQMYYEFNRGFKERVKKTVVYFLAETQERDVTLSFEHKNFDWMAYEDSMRKLTFDNARDLLKKGEHYLTNNLQK